MSYAIFYSVGYVGQLEVLIPRSKQDYIKEYRSPPLNNDIWTAASSAPSLLNFIPLLVYFCFMFPFIYLGMMQIY